jgi:ferredoxin
MTLPRASFSENVHDANSEMYEYLRSALNSKYNDDIIVSILKTLRPVYGSHITVSQLESFGGAAALNDLAAALLKEQKRQRADRSLAIRLTVHVPHHRTTFQMPWHVGQSLLDVARDESIPQNLLSEYIDGSCGGNMSCSTCQVYLDDLEVYRLFLKGDEALKNDNHCCKINHDSYVDNACVNGDKRGWKDEGAHPPPLQPSDAEQDMLDIAFEPLEQKSRLGCQVVLTNQIFQRLSRRVGCKSQNGAPASESTRPVVSITLPSAVTDAWN